ncbi:nucleotidyltransferase [Paraburkholderia sp. CNPSo 3076]|uniref:SMODS domain-containing nucleotidyltransferase n=1 Tax=Paraburkholderia sp. CNPSo 3076 TaxID=2940936 RepID=UPI00224DAE46|nr:nucleotidyltransferase [Paraburkholderia sp. CNPSo 3076]MCX5541492.1 nucleotidyltransferase [Paraburkholderia sp. CNPSo 3076]
MSVLSFLTSTATNAILAPIEQASIDVSIASLQSRMAQHFAPGMIKQHFRFGSSTRGTILPRAMDEQSDIDYMIVFNDGNATPQTYLSRLRTFVEKRYRSSEIYQSNPTIVLELNHIKFDLVPATTAWLSGLRIPSGPDRWISTAPNDFNGVLEAKNKANKSLIKPTIRLFKYWNAASGYPFESFAIEKWVCDLSFWWQSNQRDYFFDAVESLSTSRSQSQRVNDEISRAKKIIANVRQFEKSDMQVKAETEIRKLFRL